MFSRAYQRVKQDGNLTDLLQNSGILYIGGLISLALTFAQQISTANLLGSIDYGRLAIVLSSGLLLMLVTDFRTWEIGIKLLTHTKQNQLTDETTRVTTWLIALEVITGVLSALLLLFFAPLIATHLLQAPDLTALIQVYALAVPFRLMATGILSVFPRLYGRFSWLAWKSIAYSFVRLILMSGAAFLGLGLQGVIIGAILGEVFNFILLIVMAYRLYRPQVTHLVDFTRPQQFTEGRRMLGELWVSSTIAGLHYQTFIPIMALLTSPAQVGLIRSGLDIAEMLERIIQPLSIVFTPKIVSLYQSGDRAAFHRYLKQCAALLSALVIPIVLGIMLLSPLLPRLLGDEGFEGIATVANILVFGTGFHAILQWWLRPAAIATNTIYQQNIAQIILVIFVVVIMIVFIPSLGAIGGAWAKLNYLAIFPISSLILFLYQQYRSNMP